MRERVEWIHSSLTWPFTRGEVTDLPGGSWSSTTILPEQFHSTPSSIYQGRPETALMHAVLEDAVNCVRHGLRTSGRRKLRMAREAEEWVFSDDSEWPFSFLNICTVLGLDPYYIRRGLRHWRQQSPVWTHKNKRRVVRSRYPITLAA